MTTIPGLKRLAENFEPGSEAEFGPEASVTITTTDDAIFDLDQHTFKRLFSSMDGLDALEEYLTEDVSLRVHDVQFNDSLWTRLDSIFWDVEEF